MILSKTQHHIFGYTYVLPIFSLKKQHWHILLLKFSFNCRHSVQFSCSVMSNSLQSHGLQHASLPCHQLLELTPIHVHWVHDVIQPSHPLSSPSPPASVFPSIRVFSNESVLHIRWSKYRSFSFSIRTPNKYSGLISFRIDWLNLLAVQGTRKIFLQYHSSKESVLQH